MLDPKNTQKTSPGQKTDFLRSESEKSENMVPYFENFGKYIKDAPKKTVLIGSYDSPNELMRFPNKAKPIWGNIQKLCKNAVINQMVL